MRGTSSRISTISPLAIALIFTALWTATVSAAESRERFSLQAGALFFDVDGDFSSVRDGRPNFSVSLDDVGIDTKDESFIGSLTWNMGNRWVLRFDTFGFDSSGTRTSARDFVYDDTTVTVGMQLQGGLDLEIYMLNLGYRFIDTDRWDVGAGLGAHYIRLDFGFEATLSANGDNVVVVGEAETKEQFPVPNLYAWTNYRFSDRLELTVSGGWLSAKYDNYDGELYFLRSALEFGVTDRFGIGAGYWISDFDVERERSKSTERYDVDLPGPYAYLFLKF